MNAASSSRVGRVSTAGAAAGAAKGSLLLAPGVTAVRDSRRWARAPVVGWTVIWWPCTRCSKPRSIRRRRDTMPQSPARVQAVVYNADDGYHGKRPASAVPRRLPESMNTSAPTDATIVETKVPARLVAVGEGDEHGRGTRLGEVRLDRMGVACVVEAGDHLGGAESRRGEERRRLVDDRPRVGTRDPLLAAGPPPAASRLGRGVSQTASIHCRRAGAAPPASPTS